MTIEPMSMDQFLGEYYSTRPATELADTWTAKLHRLKVVCYGCDGKGFVPAHIGSGYYIYVDCEECNGTGNVRSS